MKFIIKIIGGILFILFFVFFFKNMQEVPLKLFVGYEVQSPLALLLFEFFLAGAILGVLGMASIVFRYRRDLSRHKKTIADMKKQQEVPALQVQASSSDVVVRS